MHGITRTRNLDNAAESDITYVHAIVLRYSDGRTLRFLPDGDRDNFNQDDTLELVKVLMKASSTAEWAEINSHLED